MTLLMTTMCPERLFFMSGITSLIMRTTPKKLVSNTCFISSMLMLSTGPSKPTPALLTDRKHTCYHPQPLGGITDATTRCRCRQRQRQGGAGAKHWSMLTALWVRGHQPSPGRPPDNCSHLRSYCLWREQKNRTLTLTLLWVIMV